MQYVQKGSWLTFFWEVIPIVNFTYIAFVFVVFTPRIFLLFVIDLPIEMTSKISPLPLPKILSRLVERSVIRVEDKFDRRWHLAFAKRKIGISCEENRFFPSSRLDTMKHVLVSRDRLFSTDTSNPVLLSWNIPPDTFRKIFPGFF